MSKVKKIISTILAIIVLIGVGFGAYLLFFKKDKEFKLTEERAIKLIGEATAKQNAAINTVGKTMATDTSSQSISGGQGLFALNNQENGNLLETDINQISRAEEYEMYLDEYYRLVGRLNVGFNALQLDKDNTIKFGKTYEFVVDDHQKIYAVYYCKENKVVYEMKFDDNNDNCVYTMYLVVEYNKVQDIPSATTMFVEIDNGYDELNSTPNSVSSDFEIAYTNFQTNSFKYYGITTVFENCDNFNKAHELRSKIANGSLKYADLSDYLKYNRNEYNDERVLRAYSGNITENINDLNFKSIRNTSVEKLFNTYSTEVTNLDVINNSKIDVNNTIKDNGIFEKAYYMTAQNVAYYVKNEKFYYYCVTDFKQFDSDVLTSLKTKLATLTYENADGNWHDGVNVEISSGGEYVYNKIKTAIDLLNNYYEEHKSDETYVSVLLRSDAKVAESEGITYSLPKIVADSENDKFYYNIQFKIAYPEVTSDDDFYYGTCRLLLV